MCVQRLTLQMVSKYSVHPSLQCSDPAAVDWPSDETLLKWLKMLWMFINDQRYEWEDVLQNLNNWAVIPATPDGARQVLIPPCAAKRLIRRQRDSMSRASALSKLGMWSLKFPALFPAVGDAEAAPHFMQELHDIVHPGLCDIKCCEEVVTGLHLVRPPFAEGALSEEEADDLLKLVRGLHQPDTSTLDLLCRVPMFPVLHFTGETAAGSLTTECFFEKPDAFPQGSENVLRLLRDRSDVTVLQNLTTKTRRFLTKALLKKGLTEGELYQRMVSFFVEIDTPSQMHFLQRMQRVQNNGLLLSAIEQLAFVPTTAVNDENTCTKMPSCLFDPSHPLFAELISPEWIPAQEWQDSFDGLLLLQKFGLQSKLTLKLALRLARDFSNTHWPMLNQGCQQISECILKVLSEEELHEASHLLQRAVVELLCECDRTGWHSEDMDTLSELACVPFVLAAENECVINVVGHVTSSDDVKSLHCDGSNDSKPVCMKGCALASRRNLVSSQCGVLPEEFESLPKRVYERLQLCEPPPVDMVLEHFKTITEQFSSILPSQASHDELRNILKDIFAFLNAACCANADHAEACQSFLQELECMPVENNGVLKLLTPTRVVSMQFLKPAETSLFPYLDCFLPDFTQFGNLLKCLGVEQQPTACHFAQVLQCQKEDFGVGEPISVATDAEAIRQIRSATTHFFSVVADSFQRSSEMDREHLARSLQPLFLPCQSSAGKVGAIHFQESSSVLMNDAVWLQSRITGFTAINYLQDWKSLPADVPLPELASLLGTRLLSSAVSVELREHVQVVKSSPVGSHSPDMSSACRVNRVIQFLQSDTFSAVVRRLLLHKDKDECACDEGLDVLKKCQCVVVDKLTTSLKFTPFGEAAACVDIPGSTEQKFCHLKRKSSDENHFTVYFSDLDDRGHDDGMYMDFVEEVASVIHLAPFLIDVGDSSLLLRVLRRCHQPPSDIHKWLDRQKIARCEGEEDVHSLSEDEKELTLPASPTPEGACLFGTDSDEFAELYLKQARADLDVLGKLFDVSKESSDESFCPLLCFLAQQVAEKSLKAGLHAAGVSDMMLHHEVEHLAREFTRFSHCAPSVAASAMSVAHYYIPTRYPDYQSGQCPDRFGMDEANAARSACQEVMAAVEKFMSDKELTAEEEPFEYEAL